MLELINLAYIPIFLLIFVRMLSFLVVMPLFSYRTIPVMYKIGLSFFLALTVFYTIDASVAVVNELYLILLVKETLVALLIGFIAYMVLSAVQIAGEIGR